MFLQVGQLPALAQVEGGRIGWRSGMGSLKTMNSAEMRIWAGRPPGSGSGQYCSGVPPWISPKSSATPSAEWDDRGYNPKENLIQRPTILGT